MNFTSLGKTPSQTIGPFFRFGTDWLAEENLVSFEYPNAITLKGAVYDGAGVPVSDAMVEIWQADEKGEFPSAAGSTWSGFGRRLTDENGSYEIRTVKPAPVSSGSGEAQAPHIVMVVFARGLLKPVFTRIYFPEEQAANGHDPLLRSISDPVAKSTLIAVRESENAYRFDIRLQDSKMGAETQFIQFGI